MNTHSHFFRANLRDGELKLFGQHRIRFPCFLDNPERLRDETIEGNSPGQLCRHIAGLSDLGIFGNQGFLLCRGKPERAALPVRSMSSKPTQVLPVGKAVIAFSARFGFNRRKLGKSA